jgi:hypothetical protein
MVTSKSSLYIAAALPILALLGAACSSSNDGSDGDVSAPANGGTTGSTSSPRDGGQDGGNYVDASSLDEEQLQACEQASEQVDEQIAQQTGAYQYGSALYDCTTDDDCVFVDDSTRCAQECGVIVSTSQAAAYARAVAAADSEFCGNVGPCPGAGTCNQIRSAACYDNSCTFGFPAAWQSFVLEADTGGTGSTLPASCSGTSCTLWTVTPDAKVTVSNGSAILRTTALSSADFATLDGILRSSQFREEATSGVSCVEYTGPEHVSESVERGTVAIGGDVSSCVAGMFTGDSGVATPGNDYLDLYNVLKGY